ncbi:MAG: hypothetical protein AAGG01_00315 [Planctomycetota bacterium]
MMLSLLSPTRSNAVRPGATRLTAMMFLFASAALAPLAGSAAAFQDASPVSAELLVGHPALVQGDAHTWIDLVLDALESDPAAPLADLAATLAAEHSEGRSPENLAAYGARLARLADLVPSGQASLALRRGVHANARARRYGPLPADLPGDLYPEFVRDWFVVGPLGALDELMPQTAPAPDLSDHFGPGDRARFSPEPDASDASGPWRIPSRFQAADGAQREWTALRRTPNQTGARWQSQVHPDGGQTYALALLRPSGSAALEEPLTLEIRTQSAVRAWWNGVLAIDEPRLSALDRSGVLRVLVTPSEGEWNALLVRVGTDSRSPLAVRLLDGADRVVAIEQPASREFPAGGLEVARGAASPPQPAPNRLAEAIATAAEAPAFGDALKMLQATFAGRADIALAQGRPDGIEGAELDAWLRQRLIALRVASHLPGELRRRLALEVIDELKERSALGKVGYEYEVARLLREDKPAEALEAAEAFARTNPRMGAARMARVRALRSLDRSGFLAAEALREFVRDDPHHAEAQLSLARLLSREGEKAQGLEHAWAALRADASSDEVLEEVLDAFGQSGDPRLELLLEAARRWEADHDAGSVAPGDLREILGTSGRFQELVTLQAEHAAAHPQQSTAWWMLGNGRLRLGDEAGATEAFRRELSLSPGDETTRELLARLGQPDPAEAFFEAFAPDAGAALSAAKGTGEASVVEALDSGLVYFFPDGSMHSRYRTLTQPLDRSGAEALNAVPVREGTRSIRITKDSGDVQEPVEVNGEWVMPALEPGDVIDMEWDRLEDGTPGSPPQGQLWRFASFERAFPTSRWVLYVPDGLPGELKLVQFEGTHETVPFQDGKVHILTASSEQLQEEPMRPSDVELLPIATYGADRSRTPELRSWWGYAARNTAVPADLEGELRAFIAEATEDVDPSDKRAQAKALFDAVDDYLQSFEGDESAPSVWLTKKGWPAFLLGALYERAAIPYSWAVLKSAVAPEIDTPSQAVFEGVESLAQIVLRLRIEDEAGDPIWVVHSGAPGAPFGGLRPQTAGAEAWILDGPDGSAHEEAVPRTQADNHWNLNLSLNYAVRPDGSAGVAGRLTDASPGGMVLIEQIRQATAQQRDSFAKSQAAQFAPGVDLSEARIVLDGSEGPGMVLLFGGVAKDFANARGEEHVAAIPFVPLQLDRAFGPAERRWPLVMRQVTRLRVRIHVDPGEDWELLDENGETLVQKHMLEVGLSVEQDHTGGRTFEQLFIQRGLRLRSDELPEFLGQMGKMEQAFRRPLRLKKKGE